MDFIDQIARRRTDVIQVGSISRIHGVIQTKRRFVLRQRRHYGLRWMNALYDSVACADDVSKVCGPFSPLAA